MFPLWLILFLSFNSLQASECFKYVHLLAGHSIAMHVPEKESRAPPLADKSRPERLLLYAWERDQAGRMHSLATAFSFKEGVEFRREHIRTRINTSTGDYELEFSLWEKDGNVWIRSFDQEELNRCSLCHSVQPRTGRLELLGKTSFRRFPDRDWIDVRK